MVAHRKLHLLLHLPDGFLHRAAQVANRHAVLNRHVARIPFAVDFGRTVENLHVAKLCKRNPLSGRQQQADVLDGFSGVPVRRLIPHHKVVALLALQHLAYGLASDGGLDRVLYVGHVDPISSGLFAVHHKLQIGLADHAK